MAEKYVYDLSEGNIDMKPLLGGKGAGVAEMMRIGIPCRTASLSRHRPALKP